MCGKNAGWTTKESKGPLACFGGGITGNGTPCGGNLHWGLWSFSLKKEGKSKAKRVQKTSAVGKVMSSRGAQRGQKASSGVC